MSALQGKNILLGISGGIAAYKAPLLIRLLKKEGAEVKVAVTPNALRFVTPLTLETLSQHKIYADCFEPVGNYAVEHIGLADWADYAIVAPATANLIGKYAGGIADDALSTVLLAFNKPVFLAPAMNAKMYDHSAVQTNLQTLKQRGVHILEPVSGLLACGVVDNGKMQEPEEILQALKSFTVLSQDFKGKTVLISAGPTQEAIDPVRYITNHSSGLMGYALAEELAQRGAQVLLVSGPVHLTAQHQNIETYPVISAQEMAAQCFNLADKADIVIMAAAVSDYTPVQTAIQKIKKEGDLWSLELHKTTDILEELGKRKKPTQILAGFALETHNEYDNARRKLISKNLDFIVLNSMQDEGAGFKISTNKITIIDNKQHIEGVLKPKYEVAKDIANHLLTLLSQKND